MNTRSNNRGAVPKSNSVNRSQGRGYSTPRNSNNISIDLQDSFYNSKKTTPVVHSPVNKTSTQVPKNHRSSNLHLSPLTGNSDTMEDNFNLPSHSQMQLPLKDQAQGNSSNTSLNPNENLPPAATNVPPAGSNSNNIDSTSPYDSLIAMMQHSMQNTREEFRREMTSLRNSISQIGHSNAANPQRLVEFQSNPSHSNTTRSTENENQSFVLNSSHSNINLEKWKISFDGSGSVSDFLFKVETLRMRSKCSDEHLLSNFHVLLEGKAEKWYWLFSKQNRDITFDLLRHAITKEFGHLESEYEILLKLSSRKQQYKESYDDYHTYIVSQNLRLKNPLPDSSLIDILKKNLNSNMRFLLFSSEPKSLNDFRDSARKAEKVLRDNKSQTPITFQNRNISEIGISFDEADESDPQLEALQISKRRNKFDYSNIQCWNCMSYGHSYIYCSQEIKQPFCFKCGQKGVLTPKCQNKHQYQGNQNVGDMATGDSRPSHHTPSSK